VRLAGDYERSRVKMPGLPGLLQGTVIGDCYRGLLQRTVMRDCYRELLCRTVTGDCYRGLQGPSHPSVAVGYEEALGQRVGAHGLQEILQWHALAVHPEHHIKFHVIANSDSETTASESSCSMMSESLLMAT